MESESILMLKQVNLTKVTTKMESFTVKVFTSYPIKKSTMGLFISVFAMDQELGSRIMNNQMVLPTKAHGKKVSGTE